MFLDLSEAEKTLEAGTAAGCSGIWIAKCLEGSNKELTTIESDLERQSDARTSLRKARVSQFVEIVSSYAQELVPEIVAENKVKCDFVDDKTLYVHLLELCINALRVRGLMIADSTCWGSSVGKKETRLLRLSRFISSIRWFVPIEDQIR